MPQAEKEEPYQPNPSTPEKIQILSLNRGSLRGFHSAAVLAGGFDTTHETLYFGSWPERTSRWRRQKSYLADYNAFQNSCLTLSLPRLILRKGFEKQNALYPRWQRDAQQTLSKLFVFENPDFLNF